jgi:hypothetical protein
MLSHVSDDREEAICRSRRVAYWPRRGCVSGGRLSDDDRLSDGDRLSGGGRLSDGGHEEIECLSENVGLFRSCKSRLTMMTINKESRAYKKCRAFTLIRCRLERDESTCLQNECRTFSRSYKNRLMSLT